MTDKTSKLEITPVSEENWNLFEKLFGARGACANCWCMYYRLSNSDFKAGQSNDGNKKAIHEVIRSGKPSGFLGLLDGEPVAWCAFAPREDFIRLERSRVHKRIDNKEVWSVPCFFIHKKYRRSGLSGQLLTGVIDYARRNGIEIIEAYPAMPVSGKIPDTFAWSGLYKTFERTGFEIVDRTSKNRPMVRYYTTVPDNNSGH